MLKHKNIAVLFCTLLLLLLIASFFWEVKIWCFLLVSICWLALVTWGSFDMRLGYFVKTYSSGSQTQKMIAITFDDGPTPETIAVLDVLKQHNAKATFFCIGLQIEKHPDIFNRIIADGHLVGNHSYSHPNGIGFYSTKRVEEEITKNDEIIKFYSGKKVLFYRPPFGVTNPRIARAVSTTGHKVIGWNNRSLDTVITDESKILKRIKRKVRPGSIILLHDTSHKTAQVLEQLLLFLQTKNYLVAPLHELLNLKAYED